MPGVFTLSSDFNVILSKEAVDLCVHLSKLTNDQVLYIILAYDYVESPYRRKPLEERKEIARKRIWKDKEIVPEDIDRIAKAIEEYYGIIYDHNRAIRDTYLAKLSMLDGQIMMETDPSKLRNLISTQKIIEERLDETDIKIARDENVVKLRGNKNLSLIEQFQRNRKEYEQRMISVIEQNRISVRADN